MSDFKSSLIRRLRVKSREVSLELEETRAIYTIASSEFCQALSSYCRANEIPNPLDELEQEEEELDDIGTEFKALFRKIAVATHPDKLSSEEGRPKLEKAVKAKKENKPVNLISIASDLKIKTDELSYESIAYLESSILKSEEEIDNIHNSYPWVWHYAPTNKKDTILDLFINKQV